MPSLGLGLGMGRLSMITGGPLSGIFTIDGMILDETGSDLSSYTVTQTGTSSSSLTSGLFVLQDNETGSNIEVDYNVSGITEPYLVEVRMKAQANTDYFTIAGRSAANNYESAIGFTSTAGQIRKIVDGSATNSSPAGLDKTEYVFTLLKIDPSAKKTSSLMLWENAGESDQDQIIADESYTNPITTFDLITGTADNGTFNAKNYRVSTRWLLCIGDSMTAGINQAAGKNEYDPVESLVTIGDLNQATTWERVIESFHVGKTSLVNIGDGGTTLADGASQITENLNMQCPNLDFIWVWYGNVDIGIRRLIGDMQTDWISIETACEAAGLTMVTAESMPSQGYDAAQNTLKDTWNAWLVARCADRGHTCLAWEAEFNDGADGMKSIYVDEVSERHPNDAGKAEMAAQFESKV